ncbi:nucleotide-binding universal stress UspA family protein [Kitasatospora sp. MAA4]|uniref:universal stress protein n=1 Tax=Kitasatospora sp. MAA4 TaxID=3035093 RepID=UPI002473DA7C|nr:universal stress protein [Kitasatospora sp. MAA4]MDH6137576.1 nucleotide-binding universal stress UspA family protein [Kitasatospora sp. MAA4]
MSEGSRVIVGVNGSLSSLAAVYRAVEEASRRDATLVPVIAWSSTDDDRLRPLSELEHTARRRLDTVFEQAFGGYPHDVVIRPLVVRADAGHALVATADRPTDLLVVGSGRHGRLRHALHGSVTRYCRAHAVCEVLVISPSVLLDSLELTARSGAPMPFLLGHRWTAHHPATTA